MPFVRSADGHALYVRVVGRGQPCVLVHGFASDSRSFLPFLGPLLRRYRFYLPDLRGFGRSASVPLGEVDPLSTYASDMACMIDGLGLTRPAVGGISMGAFTCLAHFRDHGEARARAYFHIDQGLVVQNTPEFQHGLLGPAQPEFFSRVRQLLDDIVPYVGGPYDALPRPIRARLWRVFGQFVGAAFGNERVGSVMQYLAGQEFVGSRMLDVRNYTAPLTIMRAYLERGYDMRAVFGGLQLPVHMLIGGASRMYPAQGQRDNVALLRPRTRVTVLPGVGHVVPIEAPRAFARALGAYLSEAYRA